MKLTSKSLRTAEGPSFSTPRGSRGAGTRAMYRVSQALPALPTCRRRCFSTLPTHRVSLPLSLLMEMVILHYYQCIILFAFCYVLLGFQLVVLLSIQFWRASILCIITANLRSSTSFNKLYSYQPPFGLRRDFRIDIFPPEFDTSSTHRFLTSSNPGRPFYDCEIRRGTGKTVGGEFGEESFVKQETVAPPEKWHRRKT